MLYLPIGKSWIRNYIIYVIMWRRTKDNMEKIKTSEVKTQTISSGKYLSKIRNIETGKVLVIARIDKYAIAMNASQHLLRAYKGPQSSAEYLKWVALAVTSELRAEYPKLTPEELNIAYSVSDEAYEYALEMK